MLHSAPSARPRQALDANRTQPSGVAPRALRVAVRASVREQGLLICRVLDDESPPSDAKEATLLLTEEDYSALLTGR